MQQVTETDKVLVIPCSGIGKVHGLISREATYLVTDELAPGQADTLCLALLVKGDEEALARVQTQPCITIDGCPKACAQKNVALAGGQTDCAFQVLQVLKQHRGAQPGSASGLNEVGWTVTRELAELVRDKVVELSGCEVKS
jgi:uncharacterized metal-binding protein